MLRLATLLLIASLASQALTTPVVNHKHDLLQALENGETVNILLSMNQGSTKNALRPLQGKSFPTRGQRLTAVAELLKDRAAQSQKDILSFLEKESSEISVKSLWISNQIMLKGADLDLVQKLLTRNDISKIEEEIIISQSELFDSKVVEGQKADDEGWGVVTIRAADVWATGNTGQNVTVANIDGGVLNTHEALKDNWRSDYGWFDVEDGSEFPNYDFDGHGTHTMGTIAGRTRGVGVAPGATWITCKMCDYDFNCSNWGLLECGQWLACPTKWDGSDPDCSKAPHVISNSWGFDQENYWYEDVISAWHAGGIIPVFALGNSGSSTCGTAHSPGDYADVIGVGSTNIGDFISNYSSVGPTVIQMRMKPDIVAPGENILSTSRNGTDQYELRSGTSMSCPHVVGLVALILSENPDLTYDQVKEILQNGAVHINPADRECNGVSDETYPNYQMGYGRVDAVNSIAEVTRMKH